MKEGKFEATPKQEVPENPEYQKSLEDKLATLLRKPAIERKKGRRPLTGSGAGYEPKPQVEKLRYFGQAMKQLGLEYHKRQSVDYPGTVRREPYWVCVPEVPKDSPFHNRIFLISTTHGESTYVVDPGDTPRSEWGHFIGRYKDDYHELAEHGRAAQIRWKDVIKYREDIKKAMTEPLPFAEPKRKRQGQGEALPVPKSWTPIRHLYNRYGTWAKEYLERLENDEVFENDFRMYVGEEHGIEQIHVSVNVARIAKAVWQERQDRIRRRDEEGWIMLRDVVEEHKARTGHDYQWYEPRVALLHRDPEYAEYVDTFPDRARNQYAWHVRPEAKEILIQFDEIFIDSSTVLNELGRRPNWLAANLKKIRESDPFLAQYIQDEKGLGIHYLIFNALTEVRDQEDILRGVTHRPIRDADGEIVGSKPFDFKTQKEVAKELGIGTTQMNRRMKKLKKEVELDPDPQNWKAGDSIRDAMVNSPPSNPTLPSISSKVRDMLKKRGPKK